MLSAPFLRISRKDSTKIGFKSKYYSTRLIKSRDKKSNVKFEEKALSCYLDHNNHVSDNKLASECDNEMSISKKNSSSYSSSSNKDKFCSVTYSNCPYCIRYQECFVKKNEINFKSLIEIKESRLCSINCPLQKFSSIRRSNILRMIRNEKYSSLRKQNKASKNSKKFSLK